MIKTVEKQAKQMIKKHPIQDCSNWLYHHTKLLADINVITGEMATKEMQAVGIKQIDKSYYAGAMATLRKLHDISLDSFYDANDYEKVSLHSIKQRLLNKTSAFEMKKVE